MKRYDVRSSVCPSMGPQQKLAVTGLLLGALRAGDQQLQQREACAGQMWAVPGCQRT